MKKFMWAALILWAIAVATLVWAVTKPCATGYFKNVPADQIHTMRVFEDGSFVIEYIDGTSEEGCLPKGLCND